MNRTTMLYLSRRDVESLGLPMAEVVRVVEEVFVEKGHGRVEMPPKPGIHPLPDAFIHAMPAFVPRMRAAGVKWVSGFPQNMPRQLPYISGLLVLNDPDTGFPVSVMDCTWITAKRTGAATAVAAKHLARADSRTVGILACGVQGRSNLEALRVVLPGLSRVQAYDLNPSTTQAFCADAARQGTIEAVPCANPQEACQGADIIVTSGPILKHPSPVIEKGWLKEGAFLSPVDFDSYLKPEVFAAASRLFTDDLAQQKYYKDVGYFQNLREPDGDLGELVTGKKKGRTNAQELTISVNLGLALEDMATAVLVYRAAKEKGLGQTLPL
jgi:ornithine cyclodeaminase/alanine dehydrogenase-like protein (mu-crystallin family)